MTTAEQSVIENTALRLGTSPETVASLFGFFDHLHAEHGDRWREIFPEELTKLAQNGDAPWAVEILAGTARLILETFSDA